MGIRLLGFSKRVVRDARRSRRWAGKPEVECVADGFLRPLTRFPDRNVARWHGGVYRADGKISKPSLIERSWTRVTIPYDGEPPGWSAAVRLPGRAVYGGLMFNHFGHFLLESTARLWWVLETGFDGPILFHDPAGGLDQPYARRFLELLGLLDRIRVVTEPTRVDEIVVPGPSFVIQAAYHRVFQLPFLRVGAAILGDAPPAPSDRLYLSRTGLAERRAVGEAAIEAHFAGLGYRPVRLEDLDFDEQVRLVAGAEALAGVVGSAFHVMLFSAARGRRVTGISREDTVNRNFYMIDELLGSEATYVLGSPQKILDHAREDTVLDVEVVLALLGQAGGGGLGRFLRTLFARHP